MATFFSTRQMKDMFWTSKEFCELVGISYMETSGSTIDWLMGHGMGFVSAQENQTAKYEARGTQQFVDLYEHMISDYDVEIMYETRGESLIRNENGQIVGALAALPDGGTLTVECKSVVLATGGFGGNEEMLSEYVPGYVSDATNVGMYVDGSGHRMAWDVGAALGLVGLQMQNNSLPQIALDAGVTRFWMRMELPSRDFTPADLTLLHGWAPLM